MNCKDCRHYNEYTEWSGWCDVTLPKWLVVALTTVAFGDERTVRADDECDLWKEMRKR